MSNKSNSKWMLCILTKHLYLICDIYIFILCRYGNASFIDERHRHRYEVSKKLCLHAKKHCFLRKKNQRYLCTKVVELYRLILT
jgi:hypothetical protein